MRVRIRLHNYFKPLATAVVSILLLSAGGAALAEPPSPKERYLEYHKALTVAKDVTAIEPFMSKKVVNEIRSTPEEQRAMMFGLMKEMTPRAVQVLSEKIDGERAEVSLTGKSVDQVDVASGKVKEETTGTVKFVLEDGAWKIDKESWNTNVVDQSSPQPAGQ
ncbi:MAG TPA: hypothetical protein V6D08_04945 [Candidatus Obscuribacterales bacterium]